MTFTELETPRLRLRKFRESDFAAVHSWASDQENLRYMLFDPHTADDTRGFIRFAIAAAEAAPCVNAQYIIEARDSGAVAGGAGLSLSDDMDGGGITQPIFELGWILLRGAQGLGFATEAACELTRFAFDEQHAATVTATCDAENVRSYRVMERLGMRLFPEIKRKRRGSVLLGYAERDELFYAVTREQYYLSH
ncbi:MAG: GNAT family N-acetyltransferase [Oscillospiraceae bacterium]|jgi:RimJ/RimL family protein N-acetyltransferase|nr:GNAT family N-acetyltransferase [Oscillospiraceae bacterium]